MMCIYTVHIHGSAVLIKTERKTGMDKKRKLYESPCYCTNLRRGSGAITEFYNSMLQPTGLNAAQYYLLINLSRLGTANTSVWAQHVGLDRSTLVRNVKTLEEKGWVQDTGNSGGNAHQFTLTELGENTLGSAIPVWNQAQLQIRDFLGEKEAETLLLLLRKLQELKEIS